MTPLDTVALAGPVAAAVTLLVFRARQRAVSRRLAQAADHVEYVAWMRELVAFMDAPKAYAGGLANVVLTAADVDEDVEIADVMDLAMVRNSLTA
jgi:hypothetical protein